MRTTRRLGFALLLGPLTWGIVHCSDYAEEDAVVRPDGGPPGRTEDDAGPSSASCKHAAPPEAPRADDDPATKNHYWFALDSVELPIAVGDGGVHPGVDLDDSCTCQNDERDGAAPCETPSTSRASCDFQNGADDSVGGTVRRFLAAQGASGEVFSQAATELLRSGAPSQLIYISDYNGKPNDAEIGVQFIRAGGLYSNLECDGSPGKRVVKNENADGKLPGKQYAPAYNGCDRYSPKEGATVGAFPSRTPLVTLPGYVVDGVVVVRAPTMEFPLAYSEILLTNATAVGKLTPEGSSFRLDGVISGRMRFQALVEFIGQTKIGGNQAFICTTPYWAAIKPSLCSARDVMLAPNEQFQGKLCDAVTLASGFSARAVQISDTPFGGNIDAGSCSDLDVQCL